ncbi:hypothetical protein LX88_006005 [Lentzea californiensis]|nr:hypothetical protein [Lentzea californiensis]
MAWVTSKGSKPDIRRGRSVVYSLHAHLVFPPEYQRTRVQWNPGTAVSDPTAHSGNTPGTTAVIRVGRCGPCPPGLTSSPSRKTAQPVPRRATRREATDRIGLPELALEPSLSPDGRLEGVRSARTSPAAPTTRSSRSSCPAGRSRWRTVTGHTDPPGTQRIPSPLYRVVGAERVPGPQHKAFAEYRSAGTASCTPPRGDRRTDQQTTPSSRTPPRRLEGLPTTAFPLRRTAEPGGRRGTGRKAQQTKALEPYTPRRPEGPSLPRNSIAQQQHPVSEHTDHQETQRNPAPLYETVGADRVPGPHHRSPRGTPLTRNRVVHTAERRPPHRPPQLAPRLPSSPRQRGGFPHS